MALREIELSVRVGEEWFRKKQSSLELGRRQSTIPHPLGILVKNWAGDKREWDACWVKHQLAVLSSKTLKPV